MRYERPVRDWTTIRQKSRELVTLERLRQDMIKAYAREWASLMNVPEDQFWSKAIPQALYDTLASFDPEAARLAAQVFLEASPGSSEPN